MHLFRLGSTYVISVQIFPNMLITYYYHFDIFLCNLCYLSVIINWSSLWTAVIKLGKQHCTNDFYQLRLVLVVQQLSNYFLFPVEITNKDITSSSYSVVPSTSYQSALIYFFNRIFYQNCFGLLVFNKS